MRIPELNLNSATTAPAPVPVTPSPVAIAVPVTPPPSIGEDLLHLSADAAAIAANGADDSATLRQLLVTSLLQALAGEHPLPPDLSVNEAAPQAPLTMSRALPDPAVAQEVLTLHIRARLVTPDGARQAMRVELKLHPLLIRYAPQLAAALSESIVGAGGAIPIIQLTQLPPPLQLGFQLALNPAALWPLSVGIAAGELRLRPAEAPEDPDEGEDESPHGQSVGQRVRTWLDLHRERQARR